MSVEPSLPQFEEKTSCQTSGDRVAAVRPNRDVWRTTVQVTPGGTGRLKIQRSVGFLCRGGVSLSVYSVQNDYFVDYPGSSRHVSDLWSETTYVDNFTYRK